MWRNRPCADCAVTPSAVPIAAHEAPRRRASAPRQPDSSVPSAVRPAVPTAARTAPVSPTACPFDLVPSAVPQQPPARNYPGGQARPARVMLRGSAIGLPPLRSCLQWARLIVYAIGFKRVFPQCLSLRRSAAPRGPRHTLLSGLPRCGVPAFAGTAPVLPWRTPRVVKRTNIIGQSYRQPHNALRTPSQTSPALPVADGTTPPHPMTAAGVKRREPKGPH